MGYTTHKDVPERDLGLLERFDFYADVAKLRYQLLRSVVEVNCCMQCGEFDLHEITSELAQEVLVVVVEHANVTDAILDHGYSFDAPPKREALIHVGVVADFPENVLVNHA